MLSRARKLVHYTMLGYAVLWKPPWPSFTSASFSKSQLDCIKSISISNTCSQHVYQLDWSSPCVGTLLCAHKSLWKNSNRFFWEGRRLLAPSALPLLWSVSKTPSSTGQRPSTNKGEPFGSWIICWLIECVKFQRVCRHCNSLLVVLYIDQYQQQYTSIPMRKSRHFD